MRHLSIKAKMTLWYTLFLVLTMFLSIIIILLLGKQLTLKQEKNMLADAVMDNMDEISIPQNVEEVGVDFHDVEYQDNGVNLVIYSMEGALLHGRIPMNFPETTTWRHNFMQVVKANHKKWYVFDAIYEEQGYSFLVRGIKPMEEVEQLLYMPVRIAFVLFPFIAIFAALGGYYISKKAFRPVTDIADMANQIKDGNDLTKRIAFAGTEDEIKMLADTYDGMFERLQKAFQRESQFASDVSHELRTPISVILAQTQDSTCISEDVEKMQEAFQVIQRQANKMSRLVSQLLTLAKAEKGEIALEKEKFDFILLVQIVLEELEEKAKEKQISFQYEMPEALFVVGDHMLLMRMLINLISNAIQYGKEKGSIHISLVQKGEALIGSITDNGIGIAEEHLDHIWERFYQVNTARSANLNGSSGLGLSMVQWIVTAHQGNISVISKPKQGTTFTFQLPICILV